MRYRTWNACAIVSWFAMLTYGSTLGWGDEGMWLFTDPPRKLLQDRYGFSPTEEWLAHVRESSVRFNSGGSGSFVSADGLVMTNHHVGADALQKLSSAEHDYLKQGFHARARSEELRCVDLELNVLMQISDVTERVNGAVKPEMSAAEAQLARRAVMNTIEKEGLDQTGLRTDVVTLYQGGRYHLYQFKKYTDVRLVFAPEQAIAFFGGDPDNFEFPRYDLDVCFFRAYEDGQPARVKHYLRWSEAGAQEGELIFVSGHPGRTNRLNTMAHLSYLRDVAMPQQLDLLRRREVLLRTYSERGLENARRAADELFGVQNSRKARLGGLRGLQDPSVIARKQLAEEQFRQQVQANPDLFRQYGTAWSEIEKTLHVLSQFRVDYNLFEVGTAFNSELFSIARTLVRMADEDQKANAERLREFAEAGRESLEVQLFSEAPIYEDLETIKLADSLGMLMEMLGVDEPTVKLVLAGKSPAERAAELIQQTHLKDVAVRRELAKGGVAAIRASEDAMILLARAVDDRARQLRKRYEQEVEEPQRQAYAKLAQARFAVVGTDVYPDATFTLRLAFGVVRGYKELGDPVPPWTTLGGTYAHAEAHGNRDPFQLPESWLKHRQAIQAEVPFNFVNTADIIGGNSGSPVINRDAEIVGIIFDGNIHSLVLDFIYTDEQARAIAVHSSGIMEALAKIYQADDLTKELNGVGNR